jgi:DNA-binding NtrC family response regulator
MAPNVLIVDDEESARTFCADVLRDLGFETQTADSAAQALAILEGGQVDIVLADVVMPGMSGLDLLKSIREAALDLDVVMMTGYGTIPSAVQALRREPTIT